MEPSPAIESAKSVLKTISLENLIDGFPAWWRVFSGMIRHPFRFASHLDAELDAPEAIRPAFGYALYSILVAFLVTAPVYLAHHTKANKILFPIRMCCQFAIYGVLLHYSLRLLGAKRTLSGSMASYFYLGSTGMLVYLALALPWLIGLGPDAIFGSLSDAAQLQWPVPLLIGVEVFGFAVLFVSLRWYQLTHHIRKRRVFVALMIAGLIGAVLQFLLVVPLFQFLDKAFGGFLDLF